MDELNENEILENENSEELTPKKSKKIKVLLGVIGAVIIIGLVIFILLMLTSPKYRYFSLVGSNFDSLADMIDDVKDSVFGEILDVDYEKKLTIDTEINAGVETEDTEILTWLNGFKNVKLMAKENTDLNNNYFDSNIKVILNGEEIILADLLRKNDMFSININGITDGYISADNNRLGELWEKIGYDGPDKFSSQVELIKDLGFSDSEINDLKNAMFRMGKAFTNAFGNEDFITGEGSIKYNGKEIKSNFIDFKMNSYEMNNGVIFALEQLLKEDKAIDVLLKLSNAYDNMYAQMGYEIKPFNRDEFVEALTYILEEVKALEFSETDGMVIRLYHEGRDIIEVEILDMNGDYSVLRFVVIDNGREKYYEYTNEMQSFIDNVYMAEEDVWTHTIDINYINYETGEFLDEYKETIILKVDNSKEDASSIVATSNDGLLTYSLNGNIDGDKKEVIFSMKGKDDISSNEISIKMTLLEESEFNEKILEETFNASEASDEELNTKKDNVIKNWNEFSSKNENKIVQLYTALSIYAGSIMNSSGYDDFIVME